MSCLAACCFPCAIASNYISKKYDAASTRFIRLFENPSPKQAYTAGALWSLTGAGQFIGIPLAVLAIISAIGIKLLGCCCMPRTERSWNKTSDKMLTGAYYLSVAAIPLVGGVLAAYMYAT